MVAKLLHSTVDKGQGNKENTEQCGDEEIRSLKELFGEKCVEQLFSGRFQDREECLKNVHQCLKDSSDLPKGYMIIPCQELPIEKVCQNTKTITH